VSPRRSADEATCLALTNARRLVYWSGSVEHGRESRRRCAVGGTLQRHDSPSPSYVGWALDKGTSTVSSAPISSDQVDDAVDAVSRSMIATGLKSAGLYNAASAIAAPFGELPSTRRGSERSKREQTRRDFVGVRARRAETEICDVIKRPVFSAGGETFVGRAVRLDLPRPLMIQGQEIILFGSNRALTRSSWMIYAAT
jgi:hypothetical protein